MTSSGVGGRAYGRGLPSLRESALDEGLSPADDTGEDGYEGARGAYDGIGRT